MATENAIHSLNINNTEYEIIPKRVVTTAVESGNALPVLLGGLTDDENNLDGTVNAKASLRFSPDTDTLISPIFQGYLSGTAAHASTDGDGYIITEKYVTVDTEQSINGVKTFTASERTITDWDDNSEMQLLEAYDISCAKATISSAVTCKDTKSTTTTTTTTHTFEYPESFKLMYNTKYRNISGTESLGKEGFGIVIKNTFCSDSPFADNIPIFSTDFDTSDMNNMSIYMDTATKIEMYNNDAVYHMFYIDTQIVPSDFNSISDNGVYLGGSFAQHAYADGTLPTVLYNTYIADKKIPIFIYGKMSAIISAFNTGGSTLVSFLYENLYTMCKNSTGTRYQLTPLRNINYSTGSLYDGTVPYQCINTFASDCVPTYSLNSGTVDVVSTDTTTEEITRFNGTEGKLLFTEANNDAYIKGRNLIYTEDSGVVADTNYSTLTYVAGEHSFCVGGDLSSSPIAPTEIISITSNAIAPSGTVNVGTTINKFYQGHFSSSIYSDSSVYAGYGFFESSDERLKTFVKPISVDLDKLSALKKSYFYWKDNNDRLQLGVSAQEIQKMYPELVTENEDGYLTVAYDKLSVVALAAIDKLNTKNKELEDRLLKLEDIVNKYCLN